MTNNAGIYITGGVLETPLETIRHEMETNFFGTLHPHVTWLCMSDQSRFAS